MSTLIELLYNGHQAASCNAQCYNSKSAICDCICNGLNHGVGLQAAIDRTRRDGARYVAEYVAAHPFAEHWKLRITLPKVQHEQPMLF
jgi:hypothetical protein